MAYSDSDFDAQIVVLVAAIDAEDSKAAYKAYAKAQAIHSSLTLNQKMSDQGSVIERSQSLASIKTALDEAFQAIMETSGGQIYENFMASPDRGNMG